MRRPVIAVALLAAGLLTAPLARAGSPHWVGSPAADCRARVAGLDLQTATFGDLQSALQAGRLSSVKLVRTYLDRIRHLDARTNSLRDLSPTAVRDAARLDAERRGGQVRGPLHGIPVLLKDNIGTADQPTTAGSIALEGLRPYVDAGLVARLRAAGAIVLGKTNLSEFANWVDLSMPNGYSSLGGQVKNAYTFGDPSGSSSGSGVATSMAFAAAAFGSETSGSILSPSDVNGLVGVKPTRGLVSRDGIIPLAEGFDTAGPMARNVRDAAALLTVVAGTDPADPATATADTHRTDYTKGLAGASLAGVRLGYSTSVETGLGGPARKVYDAALADLRRLGAVLVATDALDNTGNLGLAEIGLIPNDFKGNLDHYLATYAPTPRSGVKTLADIAVFNNAHPNKVKYGQNLILASVAQPGSRELASATSLGLRTAQGANIDEGLAKDTLDAFIAPGAAYANIGASAGYPTVIVPSGLVSDTNPQGLSIMGTAWSEARLLRYAAAYEAGTRRRIPPTVVNAAVLTPC
ncbi:MAG: amidase family protein [Actinomycetota bacterium]|nr:amidase family protein [Actinomycetota bacterium]